MTTSSCKQKRPMLVLPVIDLQRGVAMHGRAGQRAQYRPVKSVLAAAADPLALARAFLVELGLDQIYIADLDAIAGRSPDWANHQALLELGLRLWLDAGIAHEDQLARLFDRLGERVVGVLGLETLASPAALQLMLARYGPDRLVVSLDLDAGVPRTRIAAWQTDDAITLAERLLELGVRRLILLDLRRVGMREGTGTESLLRQLRAHDARLQIISGGGIRDVESIRELAAQGCDAVLLATALHEGRIGRAELELI
jgi:phosphoribosylformimino-5-aminoimidazole carboxamide ribotide isomerase